MITIKKLLNKIKSYISFLVNNKLDYLLIFALAFILFSYYQSAPYFPDPDSFYHAKISQLMGQEGIIHDFPWLPLTTLADHFSDQHFLYHLLLIPFVQFLPSLIGLKLFTAITASFFILLFYFLLKKLNCLCPAFFTLVLTVTLPFAFRLNLAKASAIVLIAVFLGIYFLFKNKFWSQGILAFFYVWLHGGFPVIIGLAGLFSLLNWLWSLKKTPLKQTFKEWKPFLAVLLGVLAGLIINPFWPKNLIFFWEQTVKIGLINYQKIIGVGSEWYPYEFGSLITGTVILTLFFTAALAIFFLTIKKQSARSVFLILTASFWLFFTFKSQRYIEYYVPFALLASAYIISQIKKKFFLQLNLKKLFNLFSPRGKIALMAALIYFIVIFCFLTVQDLKISSQQLHQGLPLTKYQKACDWIKTNVPKGGTMFHSDWDDFPPLFFYNSQNYYIAGLDATFFYLKHPELYRLWVDITIGNHTDNLAQTIKEKFALSWIIIEKDHWAMKNNFAAEEMASLVYEDDEVWIYHLND